MQRKQCDEGFDSIVYDCVAVDPCAGVTCSDFGTCSMDQSGTPVCLCIQGYVANGLECLYNPCWDVACSGHGTCNSDGYSATCSCEGDYSADGLQCVRDTAGTCTLTTSGYTSCIDYVGAGYTSAIVTQSCTTGSYSANSCPTASLVGSCTTQSGTEMEAVTYWYEPADSTAFASSCPGTWSGL